MNSWKFALWLDASRSQDAVANAEWQIYLRATKALSRIPPLATNVKPLFDLSKIDFGNWN